MAFIEGVGDEVTLLVALLLLFSVIVLAWVSTHTSERSGTHWSSSNQGEATTDAPHDATFEGSPSSNIPEDSSERRTPLLTSSEEPPDPPSDNVNDPPTLRHRGPGPHTEGRETISLRLKFLNETERVVQVQPCDTILNIKRAQFPGQERHVRLIYQGQLLRDDSHTVASLQLTDGCVVHCHISQYSPSPGHSNTDLPEVPLNIGSLLVPLLVLILALLWYCQFQYPHLFTATATVCLGAITLLVIAITFATYRR
ncbi:transmembrane and ubiquitin-like domain-containing protein 1 isoform X2 [Pyxicephalus adspersus]|uniref:Transmembrane and ubiquitin-like domain-containing protein 1 n=2 Tax=Pyxicephalus adspersus TaxID=30357 RepID=A0AAV3ADR5_PYXAD|nr:TPA: hypothetical protein GDO54_012933 [Pyxicephalus adspersus]